MGSPYIPPRTELIRNAILESNRTHERLQTDLTKPVDIFQIILDAGIWLMFQPLDTLYGLLLPESSNQSAGILINTKHPPGLQRYTAAHEYGHYMLGHAFSLDDADHIERSEQNQNDKREIEAQAFAANFLMPLELVNRLLKQMGLPLKPGDLTPRQVYLLSLQLGVSYRAAINRLKDLRKISPFSYSQLLRPAPKDIKSEIALGGRPKNTRADVWELQEQYSGWSLRPHVDDELYMSLPEIPSSGYVWSLDTSDVLDLRVADHADRLGNTQVALISDAFEPNTGQGTQGSNAKRYGASGTHRFAFRILNSGYTKLRLVKKRPWLKDAKAGIKDFFEVELEITPKPTGGSAAGLSSTQQPSLASAA